MRKTNTSVWFSSLLLMALLPGITGLAYADTVIDTTPSWIGTGVYPFGTPATETYGQTITVPLTDSVLQSWTFYMEQSTSIRFQGEVYAWNGFMATGPDLFESAVMTTTDPNIFQPITFDTGGLALTPGDTYVLFASSSKDAQSGGGGEWGYVPGGGGYTGGSFFALDNGTSTAKWTSDFWSGAPGISGTLAFQADFDSPAAVPEPSSRILLGTVLCAVVVLTLRRCKLAH
jgi:hypothetical protein